MIRCYDKLMVHDELTLDEIDGISGGKEGVAGKVGKASERLVTDVVEGFCLIATIVTNHPVLPG
jgi:hypothetical protein